VARHTVAELWIQSQGGHALVRVGEPAALRRETTGSHAALAGGDDVRRWAERAPFSWHGMMVAGLALAGIGGLLATLNPIGFLGAVLFGCMMTLGGGIAILGGFKRASALVPPALPAPQGDPSVARERGRRVRMLLGQTGQSTFEQLLAKLRWTEAALVQTLVALKDAGQVVEDLDLDTGEWVYRLQSSDEMGTRASMMLADRQAAGSSETA
jgi:hypothetical protein